MEGDFIGLFWLANMQTQAIAKKIVFLSSIMRLINVCEPHNAADTHLSVYIYLFKVLKRHCKLGGRTMIGARFMVHNLDLNIMVM